MKKILLLGFLFSCFLLQAQKHDYNWITGYDGDGGGIATSEANEFGLTLSSFLDEKISKKYIFAKIWMAETNTTMSDKDGNLLFYTNGGILHNKDSKVLKNSENFNTSKFHDAYPSGLPIRQAIIAIPHPNKEHFYYLIYSRMEIEVSVFNSGLNYALINMNGDNGKGEMIVKNEKILKDSILWGNITATKHANGRDWWILQFKENSNRYYRVLLSPTGFEVFPSQTIGDTLKSTLSQVCFSPNGKKFALCGVGISGTPAKFDIYDFDRCSGLLSNHKRLKYYVGKEFAAGISFSYDSKFAYTFSRTRAIQWDLSAKDISTSGDTIAFYDGYKEEDKYATTFYLSQIAPDGKIYINSSNASKYFHVIHTPNKKGKDCQLQQRGFRLKSWNTFTMPNHPNYRLGPIDGSPCDVLGIDNIPVALFRYDQDTLSPGFVTFTDLSHHEPATWQWDFGDGSPKINSQEPDHLFLKKGVYNVCLTVTNKYGKHTACKTINFGTTATQDADNQSIVQVTPNPFREKIYVALNEVLAQPIFHLYDATGKNVINKPLYYGITEIDTQNLSVGFYLYNITSGSEMIAKGKVVKVE